MEQRILVPRYEDGVRGLPNKAIPFSNSERRRAACGWRWLYADGYRLKTDRPAAPLRFGIAWHSLIEDMHRWWMHFDEAYPAEGITRCLWCVGDRKALYQHNGTCSACQGSRSGPGLRAGEEWHRLESEGLLEPGTAREDCKRLDRCWDGYLREHGRGPLDTLRPIGVELRLAVPVQTPGAGAGRPYQPLTWLVRDHAGALRMAGRGEAHRAGAVGVRWPIYQVLTVDMLLVERADPSRLWLWEAKTSSDPEARVRQLGIDTQVEGYTWAVTQAARAGLLADLGVPRQGRVVGCVFDVVCNKLQRDPKPLAAKPVKVLDEHGQPVKTKGRYVYQHDADGEKVLRSPGLSTARSWTPSWRYEAAIEQHGFRPSDYANHLRQLEETVDDRLHDRAWPTYSPEQIRRYGLELYGVAKQLTTWRRALATATRDDDLVAQVPRTPVCNLPGGGCAFRRPCAEGVLDGRSIPLGYELSDAVRWDSTDTPSPDPLPFGALADTL